MTKARRRPEVEFLEGRVVPTISFSGPGLAGLATLTGTSATDQFRIAFAQSGSTVLVLLSDGITIATAELPRVVGVTVNGNGGNDSLTVDVGNLLTSSNFAYGLSVDFNDTPGLNTLNIISNPSANNLTETFNLGDNVTPNQLLITAGIRNTVTNLININALPSETAINDSLVGSSFVFRIFRY
jgi:hypothetical protein